MEKLYNIREASELLGLKVRTMRDWIKKGKIKASKHAGGKMWFITESEIKRIRTVGQ